MVAVCAVAGIALIGATSTSSAMVDADRVVAAKSPQPIAPEAELVPVGARPALALKPPTVSAVTAPQPVAALALPSGPLGIPGIVLKAYKMAANRVGSESAQCKLPWFLLAGIGRIESNHAGNGSVDTSGTTLAPIKGPTLDGSLAGNEVIRNGDGSYAAAMGPMQFIPSTWAGWSSDGNGDGKSDPNNVFDATYAAGRYLCAGVTDIMNEKNKVAAVLRYNNSMEYVTNVLGWAGAYATGVMPTNPIPELPKPSTPPNTPGCPTTSGSPGAKPSSTPPARPSGTTPSKSSAPPCGPSTKPSTPPGSSKPPASTSKKKPAPPPAPPCLIFCLPPPPPAPR